jgi:hypothetical protein
LTFIGKPCNLKYSPAASPGLKTARPAGGPYNPWVHGVRRGALYFHARNI